MVDIGLGCVGSAFPCRFSQALRKCPLSVLVARHDALHEHRLLLDEDNAEISLEGTLEGNL